MDENKDYRLYADIAFENKQYRQALNWYRRALAEMPDDLHLLSRAGAISVTLGLYSDALLYFRHARELDPDNGDNAFHYGSACFFNKDYAGALSQYVQAEKLGCSEDVTPRLYYQMALLCSMRQDIRSSLIYFEKCEASDTTGLISLNPDLISEKLKLHMLQEDYDAAEKCAAALVAINPVDFKSYMVYFSILMAHKSYETAQRLLLDAVRYAEISDADRFALVLQRASVYMAKSAQDPEGTDARQAAALLEEYRDSNELTPDQLAQLQLMLAEIHAQMEHYDEAIAILQQLLSPQQPEPVPAEAPLPQQELTPEELEELLQQELASIQEKIDTGELDGNMGMYALTDYDEEGNPVHYYDDAFLPAAPEPTQEPRHSSTPSYTLPKELREKVVFTLLSCHLGKDDFAMVQPLAKLLQQSEQKYYSYYGLYTDALAQRKLTGNSDLTLRKYAEAIAFFRSRTVADATDVLAVIFRARLYAEEHKFAKAEELAHLLSDADRKAVLDYVEACKQE